MSRIVSAVALALALTAQVTTLVHMGAVRHETCAEHGELVEGSADHDAPVADDARDEHDHCLVGTTPSLLAAPPVIVPVVDVLAATTHVAPPPLRVVAATVLRTAPKTSPPTA